MELSPIILRNFLYFRKRSFVIFQGTGTTKSSYISESNFPSSKKKQKQKKKKKQIHYEKIFYTSRNGNSDKNSNIFSKESLYFRKWEPLKILYISGNGTFLYFGKSILRILKLRNFLILRERYIQNPAIFRTRGIFRALLYLKSETYSEHCETSTMERFAKINYLLSFKSIKTLSF